MYVDHLMSLDNIIETLYLTDNPDTKDLLQEKQTRLKSEKENMEKKLGIKRQWQPHSAKFIRHRIEYLLSKRRK